VVTAQVISLRHVKSRWASWSINCQVQDQVQGAVALRCGVAVFDVGVLIVALLSPVQFLKIV